jgi:hypothetical protein
MRRKKTGMMLTSDHSGRSLAGIGGSNPAGGMEVCLLWVLCVIKWRSASGWSLVQRSPTECGVSECDCEVSTVMRLRPTRGCRAMTIMYSIISNKTNWNCAHHTQIDEYATRQQQRKTRDTQQRNSTYTTSFKTSTWLWTGQPKPNFRQTDPMNRGNNATE